MSTDQPTKEYKPDIFCRKKIDLPDGVRLHIDAIKAKAEELNEMFTEYDCFGQDQAGLYLEIAVMLAVKEIVMMVAAQQ